MDNEKNIFKLLKEQDDFDWIRDIEPRYIEDSTEVSVYGLQYRLKPVLDTHDQTKWQVWSKDDEYSKAIVVGFDEESDSYDVIVEKFRSTLRMTKEILIPRKDLEDLNSSNINESDDLDWIRDIGVGNPITIGGNYDEEHQVFLGDKVTSGGGDYVFTIDEVRDGDNWVWGSDLPSSDSLKNYHNPRFLRPYIENIKEQGDDLDWIREVPSANKYEDLRYGQKIGLISITNYLLESIEECGSRFTASPDRIYTVKALDTNIRGNIDCGAGDSLNHDEKVKIFLLGNDGIEFWVSDDMCEYVIIEGNSDGLFHLVRESDDLDWIRDIPTPIPLPKKFSYYINMCGSGYLVEDLRDKFIELFGSDYSDRGLFGKCNWFGNANILSSESADGGVVLSISSSNGGDEIRGGWDECEHLGDYHSNSHQQQLTPKEFLLLQKPNNINESDDLDWIRDINPMDVNIFKSEEYDLRDLDTLYFGNSTDNTFSFCYDCTPGDNKTMIYRTDKKPDERYLDAERDYWTTNGAPFTWGGIRKYFNDGSWFLIDRPNNINESEEGDFDWIDDITPSLDLEIGQLFYKYNVSKDTIQYFTSEMEGKFDDIEFKDGKVLMTVSSQCELVDMFDPLSSGYRYDVHVGQWLAKKVLCDEDDFWEPYTDTFGDWEDDVWKLVINDSETLNHVLGYLQEYYLTGEYHVGAEGGKEVLFDETYLDYLVNKNLDHLGFIISDNMDFEDLKNEIAWSYDSGYNVAARDQIYKSTVGAISDVIGEGEWVRHEVQKLTGVSTRHELIYDVTDVFWSTLSRYFEYCWSSNVRYFDGDVEAKEDEFLEFGDDCWDLPYSDFLSFYSNELSEYDEQLNPRYDEYPEEESIIEYFKEDLFSRI